MKISILPNIPYGDSVSVTNAIIQTLQEEAVDLILPESAKKYITKSDRVAFMPYQVMLGNCDIIIAVGGDGTVTKYASDAALHSKPILGINAGHLGFLSGLEKTEISQLKNLLTGNYTITKRMLLCARVFNERGEQLSLDYCINDAVIGRAIHPRMVDVSVELDGTHLSRHRADAIIVSTPTGSTAYSMSAGGPVVDPHIECIIVTPVCSHSLTARSVVCSSKSSIKITNSSEHKDIRPMCLTTDSREPIEVPFDGWVSIQKADKSADFITLKPQSFYQTLQEKMIERNIG